MFYEWLHALCKFFKKKNEKEEETDSTPNFVWLQPSLHGGYKKWSTDEETEWYSDVGAVLASLVQLVLCCRFRHASIIVHAPDIFILLGMQFGGGAV